jgi:hypothetical protein
LFANISSWPNAVSYLETSASRRTHICLSPSASQQYEHPFLNLFSLDSSSAIWGLNPELYGCNSILITSIYVVISFILNCYKEVRAKTSGTPPTQEYFFFELGKRSKQHS